VQFPWSGLAHAEFACGSVDLAQMAVSLGVGVTWYSPMGPLSFSLAAPLKKPDNAETQVFQFSLGQTF